MRHNFDQDRYSPSHQPPHFDYNNRPRFFSSRQSHIDLLSRRPVFSSRHAPFPNQLKRNHIFAKRNVPTSNFFRQRRPYRPLNSPSTFDDNHIPQTYQYMSDQRPKATRLKPTLTRSDTLTIEDQNMMEFSSQKFQQNNPQLSEHPAMAVASRIKQSNVRQPSLMSQTTQTSINNNFNSNANDDILVTFSKKKNKNEDVEVLKNNNFKAQPIIDITSSSSNDSVNGIEIISFSNSNKKSKKQNLKNSNDLQNLKNLKKVENKKVFKKKFVPKIYEYQSDSIFNGTLVPPKIKRFKIEMVQFAGIPISKLPLPSKYQSKLDVVGRLKVDLIMPVLRDLPKDVSKKRFVVLLEVHPSSHKDHKNYNKMCQELQNQNRAVVIDKKEKYGMILYLCPPDCEQLSSEVLKDNFRVDRPLGVMVGIAVIDEKCSIKCKTVEGFSNEKQVEVLDLTQAAENNNIDKESNFSEKESSLKAQKELLSILSPNNNSLISMSSNSNNKTINEDENTSTVLKSPETSMALNSENNANRSVVRTQFDAERLSGAMKEISSKLAVRNSLLSSPIAPNRLYTTNQQLNISNPSSTSVQAVTQTPPQFTAFQTNTTMVSRGKNNIQMQNPASLFQPLQAVQFQRLRSQRMPSPPTGPPPSSLSQTRAL